MLTVLVLVLAPAAAAAVVHLVVPALEERPGHRPGWRCRLARAVHRAGSPRPRPQARP